MVSEPVGTLRTNSVNTVLRGKTRGRHLGSDSEAAEVLQDGEEMQGPSGATECHRMLADAHGAAWANVSSKTTIL